MNAKTIFIIIVTVLVTIILMKNTDEVNFWIFGNYSVPKLAVLGIMFVIGALVGYLMGRPRKKTFKEPEEESIEQRTDSKLDDIDQDYIN